MVGQETNCCKCCSSISISLSHFLQLLLLLFLVHKIHMKTFFFQKEQVNHHSPPPHHTPHFSFLKRKCHKKELSLYYIRLLPPDQRTDNKIFTFLDTPLKKQGFLNCGCFDVKTVYRFPVFCFAANAILVSK